MRPVSRREFLQASSVAAASVALGTTAAAASEKTPETLYGSQLYGWGQYYDRDGKSLGAHQDEVFSALRDAGYDYAEGSVDVAHPENNQAFADRLRAKGLRPVSLYTGGGFHHDQAEKTVDALIRAGEACAKAGFSVIVCNADPIGRDKTDAELLTQARALGRLGAALKSQGLRLGLHHHTPELRNNAREYHHNFALTEAGTVDFCIDTHWMYRGGVEPMDALRQYGGRVVSWHLRQSREKIWWEDLDSGDIDYAEIASFARDRKLPRRFSVELALEGGTKITRSGVENHRRSLEFVRRVFAV
jgi:sugar phosphate isomerase/epimerase